MKMQRYSRVFIAVGIISCSILLAAYQLSQFAVDTSLSHWHSGASGYKLALEQQKQNGKPIAVFFHTDWCSSCKNLRETVLASNLFNQYSQNLIPVKINPESGPEEKKIADNYRVIGYPTFLIITDDFNSITSIRTRQNMAPEKFIASCENAVSS